ncbi:PREDICTED: uncharacterized protein LOC105315165 [Amphimedon queenslandica]|uniref:Calx-beta domain-containing protein n=1 Tax=Amphimedon queenslandica TaxID=400682 RepID=A0A1X7T9A7_AMPQE|nr:PREDICTED: uncharacterized protein LOC105315165 [Amphimedon queenslandica]|eukprot:XP_019860793.1 PREDICTED: uncharacterized protein LOC105315165 [Amphimedon queenslandica]
MHEIDGLLLGFVTFGTGVLTQNRSINFPVVDDNIALEPDKHYLLRLRNIGNIGLGNPGTMNVTVVDNDDVFVSFVGSFYSYSESHGTVSNIQVQLSNPIAQDLSVNIRGGPGSQPSSVVVSGAVVSESIRFIAGGNTSVSLSDFALIDDAVTLEAVEQYDLSLISHDYTAEPSRVSLGSNTTLFINDDDVVDVTFGNSMYLFFENEGMARVSVSLSRNISQALTVTVRVEGGPVDQTIRFSPSQRVGFISFGLADDLIALEDPKRFQLRFSQHSFPDGSKVRLGSNSNVSILDNDVVSVTFAQSSYSYFESNGTASNIMLRLNTTIARPLSVLVLGGPGSQPSSVVVSGADVSSAVTFAPGGSLTVPLPSFVITNDDVALEDDESYSLSISDPSVTQNVIAADSTDIDITDDDIITINLEPPSTCLEGSNAVAVIKREAIAYEAPFEATVSNERYTGPLSPDQATVGDFDGFNFTEQHSVVFHPAKANDERFGNVSFLMPRDGIVELEKVFIWRLSVNDSRVRINTDTQFVRLDNKDVFSIGFKDLHVTIREGQVATLTIKQIGNEKGGTDIGGFPENRLQSVQFRHVSGTATSGSDFLLNSTVPRLTYTVNNTLNDISFTPITSIDDNIIEGDETIQVIIIYWDYVVQAVKEWQTATITIVDDD